MSKFVLTAQLQLQAPNNVSQVIGQIRKQLSDINVQIDIAGTAKANRDIKKLASNIKDAASSSERMGKGFAAAVRRFSASAIAYKAVGLLTSTLADATRESIAFERELIKISQVTGKTIEQLSFLSNSVSDLATNLGVASSSLLSVSRILSQAGFSADETRIALNTLAKTELAPTFDDIRQTAEGAIAIFNQFGAGAAALEEQLGSINAVAGQFAVEAGDLISVVRRTGGVFKAAGGELNELIALFTSVRATTRESAESIATGLRTIFTRIQRPKTIEYLKRYGVELEDLEGKFVGPYEAVRRLSQALAGLEEGDITFVQIAEELGGFRQIGKVIPLLQQFSVAQEALNVAQKGSGSLATDAAKAQLALAVQVSRVKEEFLELIRNVTATPTFQIMAQSALSLASALIKVADSLKPILPIITAIAAVKLTKGIGGFLGGLAGGLTSTKKFSSGGKVHAFATGGMVPGSGNRDTVPAMLTPGEFVIRKSSVEQIGASNLHSMNKGGRVKFARAGKVKAPSEYELTEDVGQLAAYEGSLAKVGNTESTTNTTLENIAKKNPKSDAAYYINSEKADPKQPVKVSGSVNNMLLGKDSKKGFASNKWLDKGLSSIDKDINKSLNKLDLPSAPSSLKDDEAVRQKVDGFALESFISGLLGKSAEGGKESFDFKGDFSNTLGDQLTRQGMPPKYLDAKRTLIGSAGIVKKGIDDKEVNVIEKFSTGGLAQKFKDGGIAQRKIGYIDYDVIANPANEAVVTKGMEQAGVKGIRLYADYLTNLATRARKDSSIGKLSAIYGVAGSGKTTLARGQGTDKGKLRETERFPILTPEDIQKSTEVIVLSSSVSKKKLDEVFQPADRTYTLSSTTEADKSRVASQRASRDTTGVGLEGRKPGTTTNVESDTAIGEALLSDRLGDKSVVLGRTEDGRVRRKSKDELVEIIKKKIGFTWGGFSPMTAGHESIMDAAAAAGIPAQDFIYLVGSNEAIKNSDPSSYRTAIFDQDARVLLGKAGAGSRGATVLAKDKGFEVPQAFDVGTQGGRRQVVVPAKGSTVFAADKDEKSLSKYRDAGYEVSNIERTGGISGTQVRDLIMSGNMGQLQQVLSPNVYELISNNIKQIRNRANVLPEIIAEVKKRETTSLAEVESKIKSLGISRVDNKKVESDPEYAAQVDVLKELRKKRDKIKSFASFEPYSILAKMAEAEPEQYGLDFSMPRSSAKPMRQMGKKTQKANLGGFIKRLMSGGIVQRFIDGGWVERMKKQSPEDAESALKMLNASLEMFAIGQRKVPNQTFDPAQPWEDIGAREVKQRIVAVKEYLQEKKLEARKKFASRKGAGLKPTDKYNQQEMLDAITLYQAGSGPFTTALASGKKTFKDREEKYQTSDIRDRLLAASQFDIPKNTYSGLGRSQLKEILNDTGITAQKLASKTSESLKALVGKNIDFPTFLSTSVSKSVAESFVQNPGALLNIDGSSASQKTIDVIKAKNKTKVSDKAAKSSRRLSGLDKINDKKITDYDDEKEFIIPPNTTFQIIKATGNVDEFFPKALKNKPTEEDKFIEFFMDENDEDFEKTRLDLKAKMLSVGGEVQKFATGGIVPGTGNRDTVPATLQAGDFVIRKRSVESIGAGNLQQMAGYATGGSVDKSVPALLTPGEYVFPKEQAQKIGYSNLNKMNKQGKYALGGEVQKFKDGGAVNIKVDDGAIGGFFLTPEQGTDRNFDLKTEKPGSITNTKIIAQIGKRVATVDEQLSGLSDSARARVFGGLSKKGKRLAQGSGFNSNTKVILSQAQGEKEVTFNDLGEEGKKRLEQEVNKSRSQDVGIPVKSITGKATGFLPGKNELQKSQVASAVALSAQKILTTGVDEAAQNIFQNANFSGIIDPSIKAFESTAGDKLAQDQQTKKTTEGYLFEGIINALTGASLSGGQSSFDFPFSSLENNRKSLAAFFDPGSSEIDALKNADAKRSYKEKNKIGKKVLGDINRGNLYPEYKIVNSEVDSIEKLASGGSVRSGTDTVPALLTPGEFVINRKSAQSIGYGKLNRMNKVGKYASGGVVGGRQRLFVGGVADKQVSRTEGYVDYTSIKQAGDDFAEILSQLGPKLAAEIQSKFKGIKSVDAGQRTLTGAIMPDTSRGQAAVFGGKNKDLSGISLQIGGNKVAANTNTLAHETGHIADAALSTSSGADGKKLTASQTEGTFQFDLVEKVKPQMAAAMAAAGESADDINNYLATNKELFAEFFAKASPEVRKIITSTTDSARGMAALKKHLEEAGHTYAGLEASDIDPLVDIIPPMDYDIKRPSDTKTDIAATAAAATPVPPPVPPAITPTTSSSSPKDSTSAPAALGGGGGGAPDDLWKSLTGNIAKLSTEINAQTSSLAGLKVEESRLESEMQKENNVIAQLHAARKAGVDIRKQLHEAHNRQKALTEEQNAVASKSLKAEEALTQAQNKKKDLISQAQSAKAEAQATKAASSKGGESSTYVETFGTTPPIKPPSGGGGKGGGGKGRGGKGDGGGKSGDEKGADGGGGGKSGDEKGADGDSGGGGIMGMDKLTSQLLGAQVALSMLTPAIDENSSSFERGAASVLNSFGSLIGAVNLATTSINMLPESMQKGVKGLFEGVNLGDSLKFLGGKGGKLSSNIVGKITETIQGAAGSKNRIVSGVGKFAARKLGGSFGTMGGTMGAKAMAPAITKMVAGFGAVAGGLLATVAVIKTINGAFSILYDNTLQLNKAIEEGDVETAKKEAGKKAGLEAGNTARAAGGAVGGGIGFIVGGPIGAAIGAALGAGIATIVTNVASMIPGGDVVGDWINQLFGGKSKASVVALAGAQAAATKAAKELADAQKVSSRVTEDFKNGTLSAGQALAKVRSATSAVDTQRKESIDAVQTNSANKGGLARDIGAYLTLGYMDTSEQRNKQIDDENKAAMKSSMEADAKRFEMTKPLQLAKARATFVAGGDMDAAAEAAGIEDSVDPTTGKVKKGLRSKQFETVQKAEELKARGDEEGAKILRESAKQTEEQILALEASLRTLQKEVEKQQKYFAAMNLGLMGAQGAAGAFSNAMSNYAAAQEAGNVSVMRSFETLQAGITSAAAGMSPDVFQNAMKETSNALRSFGADDAQIQKFEENLSAVNQAQANAQAGLKVFSQKLKDRSATGLGGLEGGEDAKFQGLFDTIVNSLPPGMGDEVKSRLEDMLKGMDIDYAKIASGDYSQIEEVFKQLGVDTLEQAKKIVEAEQQYQMAIVDAAKKRAAAENDMVAGIRKGFDLEKEAREIIASAGGPALTTQQQSKMAVDRYNAGVGQGQVALGGTSAADIRQQQKDLQRRQAEIGAIRTQAAGPNDDPVAIAARKQLQGEGGVKLSNEEANLTKQNQELYNTTKTLIDIKRKEIDIIKAKNKLQQDSFDALMSGDTEGFFDSQATQGAIDAISGGGNLADFDADTLQKAFNEIKRQAAAGVTEIGGQQIQGPGGLLERAAGATLQARGLDPAQAAMMAQQGTQMSPAEQAANNEIQQLAGTLTGFAEMDKQAADIQMRAAELQVQAAEKAKADANAEVQANKGKNLPNAPAPAGQPPAAQAPAGQAPAGQPPAGQAPVAQAPAAQTPPPSTQASLLPSYSEDPIGVTASRIAVGGAGVGLGAYSIRGLMSGGVSGGVEMADMAASTAGKGGRLAAATGYVGEKLTQAKNLGSDAVSSIRESRAGGYVADKLGALKQTKAGQGVSNLLSEFKLGKSGIGLADDATKLQKASNFAGGMIGKVTGSKTAEVGAELASKSTKLLGEGAEFAAKNLGRLAPVVGNAVKGFSKVAPGLGTIIDGAMEAGSFLSDPNAYNADKITKTTRDFGGMLESWGLGSLQTGVTAIDGQMASLLGGLEGALNPVGKIVEGGYNLAGGIQDAASLAQSNIAVAAQESKASASMSETTQKRAEAAGYTGGTENYDKLSALEKSSAQRVASSMSREKQALAAQEGGGGIKQFLQATGMSQQDFDTNYGAGASLSDVARSEKSFQAVEKQGREEQRRSESWNPFASGADSDTFKKALTEKTAINEAEARDRLQKEAAASTGGDLSGQNQELQASATTALSDISALITSMNDKSANRNNTSEIVQAIKQGIQAAAVGPSALRSGVMSVNNISTDSKSEDKGMGFDTSAMTQFSTALEKFNDTILKSIETLQNTKFTIQLEPTNININLTGTSFLQSLTNGLKQELLSMISSKFRNLKVDPSGRVVESSSEV